MKIEFNEKSNESIFAALSAGDVFVDGDGDVAMRLNVVYKLNGTRYNAVLLDSGELVYYTADSPITPKLNSKLVVEG